MQGMRGHMAWVAWACALGVPAAPTMHVFLFTRILPLSPAPPPPPAHPPLLPRSHKSERQQQSFLAVRSLGAADEADDAASWVERSRRAEEGRKRAEAALAAAGGAMKRGRGGGEEADEEEEGRGQYGAKDLAGLKVRLKLQAGWYKGSTQAVQRGVRRRAVWGQGPGRDQYGGYNGSTWAVRWLYMGVKMAGHGQDMGSAGTDSPYANPHM